jgi:hypothetical protein
VAKAESIPGIANIHIAQEEQASVSVTRGAWKCTFAWSTKAVAVKEDAPAPTPKPDNGRLPLSEVVAKLGSACFSQSFSYWTYTACLGGDVAQTHGGDRYILGKYQGPQEPNLVLFANGQICAEVLGSPARKTTLKLACADSVGLSSVEELTSCVYQMTAGHPDLCKDDRFERISVARSESSEMSVHHGKRLWILELKEAPDDHVSCQAMPARVIEEPFDAFHSFSLRVEKNGQATTPVRTVARSHNRVPLPKQQYSTTKGIESLPRQSPVAVEFLRVEV